MLDNLLGKLAVLSGCNEYNMDPANGLPEFKQARAVLTKVKP